MAGLRIGELARRAGVSSRAVRYYHSVGLLSEPRRDTSGYRRYDSADLARLVEIVRLRAAEVPLAVIAALLQVDGADRAGMLNEHATRVEDEISRLRQVHSSIVDLLDHDTRDAGCLH